MGSDLLVLKRPYLLLVYNVSMWGIVLLSSVTQEGNEFPWSWSFRQLLAILYRYCSTVNTVSLSN